MAEPLQPVGGVGVALVVDILDVDDGGEVAVERDLADVPRQVGVGDDAGGGEVAQLRLQLRLAHHGHAVVLEIQGLNWEIQIDFLLTQKMEKMFTLTDNACVYELPLDGAHAVLVPTVVVDDGHVVVTDVALLLV